MNWVMPAETAPQERVWMAFPPTGVSFASNARELDEARLAWAAVADAVSEFEPVTMAVDPRDLEAARQYLSSAVEVLPVPLNDAWMRDIGPTFVHGADGQVGAVNWVFNGWGQQPWARWNNDSGVGALIAAASGAVLVESPLVNEGGGIQVDGAGTVVLTDSVQRDPLRNPGLSRADVEAELARTIGTTDAIWLQRGLYRDTKTFGTKGHSDLVVAFPSPGVALVHEQTDPGHPDFAFTATVVEALKAAATVREIVRLPAPSVLRDDEDFVDYSYINHLVVNNAVIACAFGDSRDNDAVAILAEHYPGRRIVPVDARPIFACGGGIHCITQHQPTAR